MEDDIYTLLGYNQAPATHKKSSSYARNDAFLRSSVSSAKINTLKIKQKARDLQEMRSIPVINEKSRKIAEKLKKEKILLMSKAEIKQEVTAPAGPTAPPNDTVRMSVNIMKQLDLFDAQPPQPDPKNMNVHERTKYWKDQKEKKLEEQRKLKKDKELDGCTFKPQKVDIQDFEIKTAKEPFFRAASIPSSKNLAKEVKAEKPDQSLAFLLKGLEQDKAKPLAQGPQTMKLKQGFLSELSRAKK